MTCTAFLTIFGVVKVFPLTVEVLETHGTYCVFGTVCWLTAAFSYWFVPETSGKSMSELHNLFGPQLPSHQTSQQQEAVGVNESESDDDAAK